MGPDLVEITMHRGSCSIGGDNVGGFISTYTCSSGRRKIKGIETTAVLSLEAIKESINDTFRKPIDITIGNRKEESIASCVDTRNIGRRSFAPRQCHDRSNGVKAPDDVTMRHCQGHRRDPTTANDEMGFLVIVVVDSEATDAETVKDAEPIEIMFIDSLASKVSEGRSRRRAKRNVGLSLSGSIVGVDETRERLVGSVGGESVVGGHHVGCFVFVEENVLRHAGKMVKSHRASPTALRICHWERNHNRPLYSRK